MFSLDLMRTLFTSRLISIALVTATLATAQTPTPTAQSSAAASPGQPKSFYGFSFFFPSSSSSVPPKQQTQLSGTITNRGTTSANAVGTPLGRYEKTVYDAIGLRWYQNVVEKNKSLKIGTVQVEFWVDPSGRVKDLKTIKNSSNEAFANVCLQSILEVHLPPIPADVAAAMPPKGLAQTITFTLFPK